MYRREKNKSKRKKYNLIYIRLLSISFIFIIFLCLIINILKPNENYSSEENRILTKRPKFSIEDVLDGKFTNKFQKYVADHFVFRNFFIGVKSDIERIFGKNSINGVYIGKDGYLIQSFSPPKKEKMDEIISDLKTFAYSEGNINKSIAIVPNAIEILRDKLQNFIPDKRQIDYINTLRESLEDEYNFIDVYKELKEHKDEDIYYKTDHHWTMNGAYYGYKAIMEGIGYVPSKKEEFDFEKITNSFYGTLYSRGGFRHIAPDSIDVYVPESTSEFIVSYPEENLKRSTFYDLEALDKKDKYTIFFGGNHGIVKINSNGKNHKNLLIIKDSYANSVTPLLSKDFTEISMIDLRYFNGDIYKYIEDNKISDVIFLYNANTFFEDNSLKNLLPIE